MTIQDFRLLTWKKLEYADVYVEELSFEEAERLDKVIDVTFNIHQEKMKQHDALVKMMAQDEKEGNYQDKCCILQTTFCNIGLDDICVNCGKNITPSPPSNL